MTDVGALYEQHWPEIYRFLRRRMHRASDAEVEDLAAKVFERVVLSSHRYEERGQAHSWLYEIARNLLVDHVRHAALLAFEPLTDALGRRATADAGSARHLTALEVAEALMRLPIRQRAALVGQFWSGDTLAESALLLGCSVDNVKHLRWYGLRRLRRELLEDDRCSA